MYRVSIPYMFMNLLAGLADWLLPGPPGWDCALLASSAPSTIDCVQLSAVFGVSCGVSAP